MGTQILAQKVNGDKELPAQMVGFFEREIANKEILQIAKFILYIVVLLLILADAIAINCRMRAS